MPDKGWRRRFDDPIPVPGGRQLITLQDAGTCITKLPKAEHEAPEWLCAPKTLSELMPPWSRPGWGQILRARLGAVSGIDPAYRNCCSRLSLGGQIALSEHCLVRT